MNLLPEDIIGEIYSFIPITTTYCLNKKLFLAHYPKIIVKYSVHDNVFQNYIRNIIRNDCTFQLKLMLNYKKIIWGKPLKWKYKYSTYPSFLIFLKLLSSEYNSQNCRMLINNTLESINCNTKKIRHKKIRWG